MFTKESSDYRKNGHYIIGGEHFFSIWKFKNLVVEDYNNKNFNKKTTHRFNISNNNLANYNEAEKITKRYPDIIAYEAKPDFGEFDSVLIFPIYNLIEFYKISDDVEFRIDIE